MLVNNSLASEIRKGDTISIETKRLVVTNGFVTRVVVLPHLPQDLVEFTFSDHSYVRVYANHQVRWHEPDNAIRCCASPGCGVDHL